ncbi:MAG: RNA polymerase sigma-70 factor [Niabella sp.]
MPYLLHAIAENSDEQAFDELFRMYYPALLSYISSVLKDRQAAEEICVDVLFKLWQNRKMLSTIKNLSYYLYIAAKHGAISYMRSRSYKELQRNTSLENAGEQFTYELTSVEARIINKETLHRVNAAVKILPPRCRLIFKLVKEDGLKYTEVAQLLELSVKTVENQITIAMKKLAEALAGLVSQNQTAS